MLEIPHFLRGSLHLLGITVTTLTLVACSVCRNHQVLPKFLLQRKCSVALAAYDTDVFLRPRNLSSTSQHCQVPGRGKREEKSSLTDMLQVANGPILCNKKMGQSINCLVVMKGKEGWF